MSWRSAIRPASFRGIPFGVLDGDKEGGRRTVIHEFPQREDIYVEDMGAAPIRFTLQAFVLGADYMARRDALEAALNAPGPGTLTHPWYGDLTVSQCAPYKVKFSAQEGGMAIFTLSFARVPDGAPAFPQAVISVRDRALEKADAAGALAAAAFDKAFSIAGQTLFVVEGALKAVLGGLEQAQGFLGGDVRQTAALLGVAAGKDFLPALASGKRIWGLLQKMGRLANGNMGHNAGRWAALASAEAIQTAFSAGGAPLSVSRARIVANDAAMQIFTRQIAVAEASRALAFAAPESRAAASKLRDAYMDAVDAALPSCGGELYTAFVSARAAALSALAENARAAGDIAVFTPVRELPALVLAYRVTGSIEPEADMVKRNRIRHPGFMPVKPLEALL